MHVPMLSELKYSLLHLTPIPIMRDNTSFILNTNAYYFLKNNKSVAEISLPSLSNCTQIHNITLCNTSIHSELS